MAKYGDILQGLQSQDVDVVRDAAFAAGEVRCVEAVTQLANLLTNANLGVQEAADKAIRKIGGTESVAAVIPLLRSDDAPQRNLSMDILRQIGCQDLDTLIQLLKDVDPDIRIFIADILGSTQNSVVVEPLCDALLNDSEVNVRYQAAVSLGELAQPKAARCLNQALADEEWVQFAVIEALMKVRDESSLTALIKTLDQSSDLVASMIVDALGEMGDIKAVGLLLKRLDASGTALRNKMVKAIVQLVGPNGHKLFSLGEKEKFGDYLLVALADDDVEIQDAVIQGFGFLGGSKAAHELLNLGETLDPLQDQDRIERIVQSLTAMGFQDVLVSALIEGPWKRSMIAVKVISALGQNGLAPLLQKYFWDKDRDLQREMAKAIAGIASSEADSFFIDILNRHSDGHILKLGLRFLGQKTKCAQAVSVFLKMLEHPYDDVKEAALEACVSLGSPEVLKHFRTMFQSSDPIHRLMAVYVFGRLGAKAHLKELTMALQDPVPDVRKIVIEALGPLCHEMDSILPLISSRLHDDNRDVRLAVIEALGCCGHRDVATLLHEFMHDADDWVRIRAMEALGSSQASQAIPALVPLVSDANKMVALKAVQVLGQIGGASAFRILMEIAAGDDLELRTAAEEALAQIQQKQDGGLS